MCVESAYPGTGSTEVLLSLFCPEQHVASTHMRPDVVYTWHAQCGTVELRAGKVCSFLRSVTAPAVAGCAWPCNADAAAQPAGVIVVHLEAFRSSPGLQSDCHAAGWQPLRKVLVQSVEQHTPQSLTIDMEIHQML